MDARAQFEVLEAHARRADERAARRGTSPDAMLRDLLDRAPDAEPDPDDRLP